MRYVILPVSGVVLSVCELFWLLIGSQLAHFTGVVNESKFNSSKNQLDTIHV